MFYGKNKKELSSSEKIERKAKMSQFIIQKFATLVNKIYLKLNKKIGYITNFYKNTFKYLYT